MSETTDRDSAAPPCSPSFEAVPPFRVGDHGLVYDANGSRVLVCSLDFPGCAKMYAEDRVDSYAWFICECGRLGQRMEEATPSRCGL
jgi:hypothetical protein